MIRAGRVNATLQFVETKRNFGSLSVAFTFSLQLYVVKHGRHFTKEPGCVNISTQKSKWKVRSAPSHPMSKGYGSMPCSIFMMSDVE